MYDLVIRNGLIVDGSGGEPYAGDIGIVGGKIVEVGRLSDSAQRTIDADGRVVSPGFIDVHSHLDAQPFWDPTMSPSPLHGVTSIIGGNCSFSIAPLTPDAAPYLMRMLACVEGMPLASLQAGVPWDWQTTAEYFERLEGRLAINAGFLVGHSAVRRVVMGSEATERTATDEEVGAMAALLRAGLQAGALGFSSTRGAAHHDGEGRPVPSRLASDSELISLASVVGEYEGTSLEYLPTVYQQGGFPPEIARLMVQLTLAARRPLNWNLLLVDSKNLDEVFLQLDVGAQAQAAGGKVVALTLPDFMPARRSFLSGMVLDLVPGLTELIALPTEERLAIIRDPARREYLRHASSIQGEYTHQFGHLADWPKQFIVETSDPRNARYEGTTVGEAAAAEGKDAFDLFMDIVATDELKTTFSKPPQESSRADWEARAKVWADPRVAIGGSDSGAHLDMISNFCYPTVLLSQAVRRHGVISIQEAVRLLTSVQADLYGLVGRGRIAVGATADLVVLDIDAIALHRVETRYDLPTGAGRLYAEADGVGHVVVGGTQIVRDGAFTGELGGRVLKSGVDTRTPSLA